MIPIAHPPEQPIPKEDIVFVGTIGDLRAWITRSKDDLRFLFKDVFLVFFSFAVGITLLLQERRGAKSVESHSVKATSPQKILRKP
jgi:hypothetical protein